MSSLNFHLISLTILLVITFALKTQADQALIDDICRQSQDYNFCISSFKKDLRSFVSDINGLATISAALTSSQARDTSDRINGIVGGITDPVGKKRILACQSDYGHATEAFKHAFSSASVRSYWDVITYVRDGFNRVVDCENNYRRDGPVGVCPVSGDNHDIIKLTEIVLLIVNRLLT